MKATGRSFMSFATPEFCKLQREWDEFRESLRREDEELLAQQKEAARELLKKFRAANTSRSR